VGTGGEQVLVRPARSQEVPLFKERPVLDSRQSPKHGMILEKQHHEGCEIPLYDHETLCLHLQTSGQAGMEWLCSEKVQARTLGPWKHDDPTRGHAGHRNYAKNHR
jgi:hypothetical protein